jgi:hypothetical protein
MKITANPKKDELQLIEWADVLGLIKKEEKIKTGIRVTRRVDVMAIGGKILEKDIFSDLKNKE